MTELKVRVEDDLLATLGQEQVEQFLRYMVEQLHLKATARDARASLDEIDLASDPRWKQAREEAWSKYVKHSS